MFAVQLARKLDQLNSEPFLDTGSHGAAAFTDHNSLILLDSSCRRAVIFKEEIDEFRQVLGDKEVVRLRRQDRISMIENGREQLFRPIDGNEMEQRTSVVQNRKSDVVTLFR